MKKIEEIWFIYKNKIILTFAVSVISIILFICIYFFNVGSAKADSIEFKEENSILNSESMQEKTNQLVKVDVKGEVKKPGMYELEEGSRVNDLIKKAGGLTSSADVSVTNLSKKLTDEMVVIIYSKNQVNSFSDTKEKEIINNTKCKNEEVLVNGSCINSNKKTNNEKTALVNINTASLEELMSISGIGEAKAKAIIEYRTNTGRFNDISDIMNVSGIGQALFEKIKESITV